MSHYPSSAELASFRSAIHDANIAAVERITGRPTMTFVHPSASPAFPSELRGGIGYSGGSPTAPFLVHEADGGPFPMGYAVSCAWADAYDHSWAREAAGAMRHRDYMRDESQEWRDLDPSWFAPEVAGCCPHYRDEHSPETGCSGCDAAGWPLLIIAHGYGARWIA